MRNNTRILDAARAVLIERGPDGLMAHVAERAGVGVGSIYRRYATKDMLIQQVLAANMAAMITAAETAITQLDTDPWTAFEAFMRHCVSSGAGDLLPLAGAAPVSQEELTQSKQLGAALERLLDGLRSAGMLRDHVTTADLYLIFAILRVPAFDTARAATLQQRYLSLLLDGLRSGTGALAGPDPTWSEIEDLFHGKYADNRHRRER